MQAVTNLKNDITAGIATIGRYYVCFVDFKKAFDSIDRKVLLMKLLQLGIGDQMGHAIQSVINLSGDITTDLGVPQGGKLSPLLFSLFLSDLSLALGHTVCKTYFYADDLAIGATVTDDLEKVMTVLEKYCSENYLNVSIDKTKVVKTNNLV